MPAARLAPCLALVAGLAACGGEGRGPVEPGGPPMALPLELATAHFTLRYSEPTAPFVAAYAAALEEARPRVTSDLGVAGVSRVEGHLHPDAASFTAATGHRATGSVDGPRRFHVVAVPFAPANAVHEFAHNVTLHLDPGAGNGPIWLWESVALYEAGQLVPPGTLPYLAAGQFPRLSELERDGRYSIYDVGFTIAECVVEGWGREGLRRLILAGGDARSALGVSEAELEQRWRDFVVARYL